MSRFYIVLKDPKSEIKVSEEPVEITTPILKSMVFILEFGGLIENTGSYSPRGPMRLFFSAMNSDVRFSGNTIRQIISSKRRFPKINVTHLDENLLSVDSNASVIKQANILAPFSAFDRMDLRLQTTWLVLADIIKNCRFADNIKVENGSADIVIIAANQRILFWKMILSLMDYEIKQASREGKFSVDQKFLMEEFFTPMRHENWLSDNGAYFLQKLQQYPPSGVGYISSGEGVGAAAAEEVIYGDGNLHQQVMTARGEAIYGAATIAKTNKARYLQDLAGVERDNSDIYVNLRSVTVVAPTVAVSQATDALSQLALLKAQGLSVAGRKATNPFAADADEEDDDIFEAPNPFAAKEQTNPFVAAGNDPQYAAFSQINPFVPSAPAAAASAVPQSAAMANEEKIYDLSVQIKQNDVGLKIIAVLCDIILGKTPLSNPRLGMNYSFESLYTLGGVKLAKGIPTLGGEVIVRLKPLYTKRALQVLLSMCVAQPAKPYNEVFNKFSEEFNEIYQAGNVELLPVIFSRCRKCRATKPVRELMNIMFNIEREKNTAQIIPAKIQGYLREDNQLAQDFQEAIKNAPKVAEQYLAFMGARRPA